MSQTDPLFQEIAKFYKTPRDFDVVEITEKLLKSPLVQEREKQSIRKFGRKVFVFTYLSGEFKVKGLVSFSRFPEKNPVLIYLRGGNRFFGLINPGSDWICCEPYTVLTTAYRGGVSEGVDEFGGEDVDDVKHLIDYIPKLEKKLGMQLPNSPMTLLGASRGAMQMFLALARFPELQSRFAKIISLSGILDMPQLLSTRPDMVKMFTEDFGLIRGVNERKWIEIRDPIAAVKRLNKELPIYIIQAAEDQQINLEQGYNMVKQLQNEGCNVTYNEIAGASHCLRNIDNKTDLVLHALTA